MEIHFTSRHFRCPRTLRDYTLRKVSKLEKIYEGIVRCDAILTNEATQKNPKEVEIRLRVHRSTLAVVARSEDFAEAVVAAIEKVEHQLVRYKSKLRERHKPRKRGTAVAI
jgi:ribosomal subunit interface protein